MRNTLRPKIRIFDLEGLRDFESKKAEVVELLKQKVFYLMIQSKEISKILTALGAVGIFFSLHKITYDHQMEKLCFIKFQILIVSSTFASNFF